MKYSISAARSHVVKSFVRLACLYTAGLCLALSLSPAALAVRCRCCTPPHCPPPPRIALDVYGAAHRSSELSGQGHLSLSAGDNLVYVGSVFAEGSAKLGIVQDMGTTFQLKGAMLSEGITNNNGRVYQMFGSTPNIWYGLHVSNNSPAPPHGGGNPDTHCGRCR